MTDDQLPPHERPTLDELPAVNDTEPPPPSEPPPAIIPRGFARHAVAAAIQDAYRALDLLSATADAVSRQLDGETP